MKPAGAVRYSRTPHESVVKPAEQEARRQLRDRILWGSGIQAYADDVLAMPWPLWRQGDAWPVRIRIDQSVKFATYVSGVIVVPSPVRELVILHEIAHHFTPVPTGYHGGAAVEYHGPAFVRASLDLIEHVLSPAAAGLFRESFRRYGMVT